MGNIRTPNKFSYSGIFVKVQVFWNSGSFKENVKRAAVMINFIEYIPSHRGDDKEI